MPTPAEDRLLARFEAIVASPAIVASADVPAILAGWRAWWRAGRYEDIAAMATALPRGFVDADRELATYAVAAPLTTRLPEAGP